MSSDKRQPRSVEELGDHYSRGDGFELAVREALKLLAEDVPDDEILEAIGFDPTNRRALEAARAKLTAKAAGQLPADRGAGRAA